MHDRKLEPWQDDPNDVHDQRNRTARRFGFSNLSTKGSDDAAGEPETHEAERNAYDRQAQQNATEDVAQKNYESTEYEKHKIAEQRHYDPCSDDGLIIHEDYSSFGSGRTVDPVIASRQRSIREPSMPEIIPLGWFHTALGVTALISGVYTLAKFKELSLETRSGQIYLVATLLTAGTALAIFQRGEFGPGHALAVMTLLALAVGTVAATLKPFGRFSRHVQALSYSSTLLFHCIPAVTDGLLRLPVGDPVLTSIEDPILTMCYLGLLVLFLVGVGFQLRWVNRQPARAEGSA